MASGRNTSDDAERSDSHAMLFNQSLAKGLAVLQCFAPGRESLSLAEIATYSGIGKSAAQRFTYTLQHLGYLSKDPVTKRYALTPATLALGYRYLLVNHNVERANPYLLDLNQRCKETINYSEPDGTDMVYVSRFPTSLTTPVHMPLGRRLPMYCTSAGRAYLAYLPEAERRQHLEASERVAYTRKTITDIDRLAELCEEADQLGYAYSEEEYYVGDLNVSAAVLGPSKRPVGIVTISAPSTRWTLAKLRRQLAPQVMETARMISTSTPEPERVAPFRLGLGKGPAGG